MRSLLLTIMFIVSLVMPVEAASYCFIGDSRFVGMKNSVEDYGVLWIARVGAGNSWYWSQRDEITGLDRDTIIVYNLGVNDMNPHECVTILEDIVSLGFTRVYMVSVTPVDEAVEYEYGYTRTNREIDDYNLFVYQNMPSGVRAIDANVFLTNGGFDTEDGLHYTRDTYRNLYWYIVDNT